MMLSHRPALRLYCRVIVLLDEAITNRNASCYFSRAVLAAAYIFPLIWSKSAQLETFGFVH